MTPDDASHEQSAEDVAGRSIGDELWMEAIDAFSGGAEQLDTY